MTETEKIILSLRSQLTGDLTKDMLFLQKEAENYAGKENGDEIANAIMELAVSLLPK